MNSEEKEIQERKEEKEKKKVRTLPESGERIY